MNCLLIVAFALVAVVCADKPVAAAPASKLDPVEPIKNDIEKDVPRDKRSAIVATYAATAPIAYSAYSAPIAYSSYSFPYAYSSLRTYPSYIGYNPYSAAYVLG